MGGVDLAPGYLVKYHVVVNLKSISSPWKIPSLSTNPEYLEVVKELTEDEDIFSTGFLRL